MKLIFACLGTSWETAGAIGHTDQIVFLLAGGFLIGAAGGMHMTEKEKR